MALSLTSTGVPSNRTADMLKELQHMVYLAQEERGRIESTLSNIDRAHDKMKQEQRVSPYYKNKLQSLYSTALQETENEVKALRRVKDKIAEINAYRNSGGGLTSEHPKTQGIRKGVLMSNIQRDAEQLALWTGRASEKPPPLCGSVPAEPDHVVEAGQMVAARVRGKEGENWILAEVRGFCTQTSKYEVYDIDADAGKERHMLSKKKVVALPTYKADPEKHASVFFPADSLVLALYPQTTCFYPAIVHGPPKKGHDDYTVLFEDGAYPDGYSPPLRVAQRYVIVYKEDRKKAL